MTLPARIDDAVAAVSRWVPIVQDKMTAPASRQWLEDMLCQYLRRGLIERLWVISAADAGDEIADSALRRVDAEMREAGIELPPTLKAYGIKAAVRGPVKRKPGRNSWFDNWRRDVGICVLVYLTMRHFGLHPTRNRKQRRRDEPSASSVVATAMGKLINVDERRIENLWTSGLGEQVVAYAERYSSLPNN